MERKLYFLADLGLIREAVTLASNLKHLTEKAYSIENELGLIHIESLETEITPETRKRIIEEVSLLKSEMDLLSQGKLLQVILDDVGGFGPISPFLRDKEVLEITVFGPQKMSVEKSGGHEVFLMHFETKNICLCALDASNNTSRQVKGRIPLK
jgi:Flp pilus assembly protein, ATPase CpaF